MNLFEILREIDACKKPIVDANTGEIIGEEIDTERLDQLEMDKETKIRNIACWMKNLTAEEAAYAEQEKAFAARKMEARKRRESLKNYLTAVLDGKAMKRTEFAISFRTTKSTEITDVAAIPVEFLVPQEPKLDRAGILQALKNGVAVPGAALKESLSMTLK